MREADVNKVGLPAAPPIRAAQFHHIQWVLKTELPSDLENPLNPLTKAFFNTILLLIRVE